MPATWIRKWYGRDLWIPNKKFTDSVLMFIDSQRVYSQEVRLRLDPRSYGITRWTPAASNTIPNEYETICRAKTRLHPREIHLDPGGSAAPRA